MERRKLAIVQEVLHGHDKVSLRKQPSFHNATTVSDGWLYLAFIVHLYYNNDIKPFIDNKTTIKTYLQLISLKKKKKKNSDKALFTNHFISFDFDLKKNDKDIYSN